MSSVLSAIAKDGCLKADYANRSDVNDSTVPAMQGRTSVLVSPRKTLLALPLIDLAMSKDNEAQYCLPE
jgi:hypothetical protein